jgi:hypothetical protein
MEGGFSPPRHPNLTDKKGRDAASTENGGSTSLIMNHVPSGAICADSAAISSAMQMRNPTAIINFTRLSTANLVKQAGFPSPSYGHCQALTLYQA